MNYYERIQQSINYIEDNLEEELTVEQCAKEAYMSLSGYYRMFLSIVGYNVKEYIRLRRLTYALHDIQLKRESSILSVALKYDYNSADSFSRAFRKQFGILPSRLDQNSSKLNLNTFERIDIMEKYFNMEDKELLEKYPDIKVIKQLDDMKAACFTYYGTDPEGHAFEKLNEWVKANNISLQDSAYRVFGYNNPMQTENDPEYGYEVCITVPDELYAILPDVPKDFVQGTYDGVKRKVIKGGKYAVLSVKRDENGDVGTGIMKAWKRFLKWLDEGKYIWGNRQYLEEHLGFSEEDEHIGGVELYLAVEEAPKSGEFTKEPKTMARTRVALFREEGNVNEELAHKCWNRALSFARSNQLDEETSHIYCYNKGFDRRPPFFQTIMISLPEGLDESKLTERNGAVFQDFAGGNYMTAETDFTHLGQTWIVMEQWRKKSKIKPGKAQWVEEWVLTNWDFPHKKVVVWYPIG